MSKQTINLGTAPTGTGGDTPRSAFTKAQANMEELYTALGASGSPAALPVSLPVLNGGTGVTTLAGLLAALNTLGNLTRSNLLGLVSLSDGVPSGAVIESGTNSSGAYTKWADGTMICRGTSESSSAISNSFGSIFNGGLITFTFPATFASIPNVIPGVTASSGAVAWAVNSGIPALTSCGVYAISGAGQSVTYCQYVAIGRWF